jgi:hypothetical protein
MFTKIKNYLPTASLGLLLLVMVTGSCTTEDFQNQAPAEAKSINQKDSLKVEKKAPITTRGTETYVAT